MHFTSDVTFSSLDGARQGLMLALFYPVVLHRIVFLFVLIYWKTDKMCVYCTFSLYTYSQHM